MANPFNTDPKKSKFQQLTDQRTGAAPDTAAAARRAKLDAANSDLAGAMKSDPMSKRLPVAVTDSNMKDKGDNSKTPKSGGGFKARPSAAGTYQAGKAQVTPGHKNGSDNTASAAARSKGMPGHGMNSPPALPKKAAAKSSGKPANKPAKAAPTERSWGDLTRTGRGNSPTAGVSVVDKESASKSGTGGSGRGKMSSAKGGGNSMSISSSGKSDAGTGAPKGMKWNQGLGRYVNAQKVRDFNGSGR